MASPAEILIVAGAFGIVALYLSIARTFIRESERASGSTPSVEPAPAPRSSSAPGRLIRASAVAAR